jgi:hypothetical protein
VVSLAHGTSTIFVDDDSQVVNITKKQADDFYGAIGVSFLTAV